MAFLHCLHLAHLSSTIRLEVSLHLDGELVHKGHAEAGPGVWVGVPGLLVHLQGSLGGNVAKPPREMPTNVIDLDVSSDSYSFV